MSTFGEAFKQELGVIGGDRGATIGFGGCPEGAEPDDAAEPFAKDVPQDLVGLALSGGGIRSATFNLGLLQGLAERKLLPLFHYLSTVSGGGYIGSFWSAWRTRNPNGEIFPTQCSPGSGAEPQPIRHLREFGRFLAPRWGLFEIETWQFFGGAISAILPALVAGFSVLGLIIWYVLLITANVVGGNQPISIWNVPIPWVTYLHLALAVVGLSTLAVLWFFERGTRTRERQNGEAYYGWLYWILSVISVGIAMGVTWLLLRRMPAWNYFEVMPGLTPGVEGRWRFFAPAIGALAAMLLLIFVRAIGSRFIVDPSKGFYRSAMDRVIARLLGTTVFWTAMTSFVFAAFLLWTRNAALVGWWSGLVGAGSGGAFGYVQKVLSRQPSRARGPLTVYVERYALPLLATAAVVAAALAVACLLFTCIGHQRSVEAIAIPAAVVGLALFFYNPNEIGLHPLYRMRLNRAYLGASNSKASTAAANRQTIERPGDDLRMEDLASLRPIHLVCCAANDLSGDHLANLSRGARSATLSRFGFTLANRFQTWQEAPAKVTLGTAMTASGAAFNSNMGSLSMEVGAAATFLMASLNLRLGYWYRFTMRRHQFPGFDLFNEMFSRTESGVDSSSIHLSDGGHFENLALYELLRRKTRYILASDCGADPQSKFDDFGNALRRAREDFGVEVDIDISVLEPNDKGLSRQHVAVGDIIYPDGYRGVLLLFKPTMVGEEPGDVLQYKGRNERFPHESTGDQFYDEKQWESYRRLGLHAADAAFRFLDDRDVPAEYISHDVFGAARQTWLPTPAMLPDQLMARAAELQAIERQVFSLGSLPLLRDLYPELPWEQNAQRLSALPTSDLAKFVPLFNQVLQLMTDVYVSCHLELSWSHPLNIGWVNWFGRWATIPAFRDLWPFLSPMYNPEMRDFFEDRLELRSAGTLLSTEGTITEALAGAPGVALEIWQAMHPQGKRPEHRRLSYRIKIREGWEIEAAMLFYKMEDGWKAWTETWADPDFFVPPSYWAAGIGKAFLDKLGAGVVRIKDDPARRSEVSSTVHMYSEAGFRIKERVKGTIVMRRE
jgi:hypothetical protein